jgi:hypothetical protein
MESYNDLIQQIDRVLVEIRQFNQLVHAKRWLLARLCFKVFGNRKKTPDALSVKDFAIARGCAYNTLSVPLMVYRSLGEWYEKQTEPIPFSIARRAVSHDPKDAERLMRIWFEQSKPDEAKWQDWLDSAKTLAAAQCKPLLDDADEAEKQLRREARKKFKRFRRRLKAAAQARFFENRYLKPDEAAELLRYLGPLMGKRSNLLKIAKPKQDQGDSDSGSAQTRCESEHTAHVAELIGAGVD